MEIKKTEEELLLEVENLKVEIKKLKKQKRFGLVWEDKPEKFDKESKNALPVLKEKGGKFKDVISDKEKDFNILIEGDNYHSLSVLNYTHRGKIDVIYIDPPYNTGIKDFKYNDYFVDKEDRFRHSKWLSFMSKRLKLAKNLLKENGVAFVSIDDNEQAQLKLLCDEIFGINNTDTMVWRKSGESRDGKMKNTTTFRKDHEYILLCFKRKNVLNKIKENPNFQNEYPNPDKDPRGSYKAGSISRKEEASNPNHKNYYSVISPSEKIFTRQFDITKEEFDKLNNDTVLNSEEKLVSRIYWGKEGSAVPAIKIFIKEERSITPYSILLNKGTTTEGTKEASSILNKDLTSMRPKPSRLIATLLQLSTNKNSIVLDFFAGTGTTGQATLKLNNKYGGNRKFILCTNNEDKICEKIAWERIKKVSKGYIMEDGEKIEGLGGNLKYLKTDFIKIDKITDNLRNKMVDSSTEILCLKENTFNLVSDNYKKIKTKIFNNSDKYTAILFDLFYFDGFVKELKKLKDKPVSVYVFSYTKDFSIEEFGNLDIDFTVEAIPEKVLETYQKIFNF